MPTPRRRVTRGQKPAQTRARTKHGPDAAQRKAVERLLEEERYTEAIRRIKPLVQRYPDHGGPARTLIKDGEIDKAERSLDGLIERDRLHIQEVFALYGALAMLNRAKGEEEAAQSLLSSLESMVEDEDDERRFAQVKRAIERLDPVQRFRGLLESLLKADAKPADRRR